MLVNEGRRDIRMEEERDLSAREEVEMDVAGEGGGAGRGCKGGEIG